MPLLVLPFNFTNGTIADANQVDSNFNAVVAVINALDYTNVGVLGFKASQIIPTGPAQATFGGNYGYTFNPGVITEVPLTLEGATGQTADVFNIKDGTGTNQVFVDFDYNLHADNAIFNSDLQMGNNAGIDFGTGPTNSANITAQSSVLDIATGCHWNGTQYIADSAIAFIMRFNPASNPPLRVYCNIGLTIGNAFTPLYVWEIDQLGNLQFNTASYLSVGAAGNTVFSLPGVTYITAGCHYNFVTNQFVADAVSASLVGVATAQANAFQLWHNDGLTIGANISFTLVGILDGLGNFTAVGNIVAAGSMRPAGAAPFAGARSALWSGTGVPSNSGGANGDFYFRADGASLNQHIYIKASGTWSGVA